MVIFEGGIFEDVELQQVYVSIMQVFLFSNLLSVLFVTGTWHISFLLRNFVYLATWIYSYVARLRQITAE